MPPSNAQTSAFFLVSVYTPSLLFTGVPTAKELPADSISQFSWDWDFSNSDHSHFDVYLGASVAPSISRPENIHAYVAGRFRLDGTDYSRIADFAFLNAPAILYPFLRQVVANLTAASLFGPVLLPLANVQHLMAQLDRSETQGEAKLAKLLSTLPTPEEPTQPAKTKKKRTPTKRRKE